MESLESQFSFLNERYGALSANYSLLREKFENYENSYKSHPPVCNQISENSPLSVDGSRCVSESSFGLVRMISIDSQQPQINHLACTTFPRLNFGISSEHLRLNKRENSVELEEDDDADQHEKYRRRRNPLEMGLGLGLDAIAAAVSLRCDKSLVGDQPSLRSSLADLIDAADLDCVYSDHL
jgi:hypothetical protein